MRRIALQVATTLLIALLATFFGFVGFMKATAPLPTLAEHRAWTIVLPERLGRLVGASEIACALALVAARVLPGRIGTAVPVAGILLVNQIVAAVVHAGVAEWGALPQNAVLVAMLVGLAAGARSLRPGRRG